jgi:hypothetical protein
MGLSNDELFLEWGNQYDEWQKTGVLQDGIIRNIGDKLSETSDGQHLHVAQRMFLQECTTRFAMMMARTNKGVKKYVDIVETLKENLGQNTEGDDYDYKTDIKNTKEFISDLKKIRK